MLGIFLLGAPGSGKDYLLKNIFPRFDLHEVQADQILSGNPHVSNLIESGANLVINGVSDAEKIHIVQRILEGCGYSQFDTVYVAVSNKVSRERNLQRNSPLSENKRLEKWYKTQKLSEQLDCFVFNNSINLSESTQEERLGFANQIESLLERLTSLGISLQEEPSKKIRRVPRSGNITAVMARRKEIRKKGMGDVSEEVWNEPNPNKKSKPLTTSQKAKAKARAARAGRKYPNLIDNMWAANESVDIDEMFEQEILADEEVCCGGLGEEASSDSTVDTSPTLQTTAKGKKGKRVPPRNRDAAMDGLPVVTAGGYMGEDAVNEIKTRLPNASERGKAFTQIRRQLPAPKGGHPVPAGYERVWDPIKAGHVLRKKMAENVSLDEAVQFHLDNQISFTENVFRPGSEMFFSMIGEAKRLYAEGKYTPADEWEKDMLESDIGEKAMYEGHEVILDYPFEELVEDSDPTDGKGIGKPWREGGGGAVYVKVGDKVRKVSFSKSGMTKKFNDPAATRSFVARHRCLTNKDKTSASYWACRWPRFFSNSGKIWW